MVSDAADSGGATQNGYVLILVLMEYGLWLLKEIDKNGPAGVLILVLMEYGLWQATGAYNKTLEEVS